MQQLTNDSEKLLCLLYKTYSEKRKSGISKTTANYFKDSHEIHKTLCPKSCFEDVDDTCRELSRAGFISCMWYDNIANHISISDAGMIYMENRFKNNFAEITDFISKFIP